MRNIFLLIAVVGFTTVNAQENELFDIGRHLQKKQVERVKKNEQKISLFPLPKSNLNSYSIPPHSKVQILPNGDRVIRNPAYNMPVIVTDIKRFRIMPNPGEDYFAKNFYVLGQPKFNDLPNGAMPDKVFELLKNKSE